VGRYIEKKNNFFIIIQRGAKFTKGKRWKLIYLVKYYNKSSAMKEEYKLKKNYKLRKQIITKYLKNENFNSPSL
jgi:hypothetical protein